MVRAVVEMNRYKFLALVVVAVACVPILMFIRIQFLENSLLDQSRYVPIIAAHAVVFVAFLLRLRYLNMYWWLSLLSLVPGINMLAAIWLAASGETFEGSGEAKSLEKTSHW